MKNLVVNADDLGWTEGVNRGIAECHRNGIVTSASLLANGAAFESAVALARSLPALGVGVHLNLSDGRPVASPEEVQSLVDRRAPVRGAQGRRVCRAPTEDGEFHGGPEKLLLKIATGALGLTQVEKEWDAQIGKVRNAGITPTHVDGHKHVHMLPGLFAIALRLAKRHGIGAIRVSHESSRLRAALSAGANGLGAVVLKQGAEARGLSLLTRDAREQAERAGVATSDYFCGIAQTGELTKEGVLNLLRHLPEGTTELMCHPGYADEALQNTATRLQDSRAKELDILTDTEVRNLVASQGIRLIDYGFVSSSKP